MDIDCRAIAQSLKLNLMQQSLVLEEDMGIVPSLVSVSVNRTGDSAAYVRSKRKLAEELGVQFRDMDLKGATAAELESQLRDLSSDPSVHGIMIESPLPGGFDFQKFADMIPAAKDVDGLSTESQGLIAVNREFMRPATAYAIIKILEHLNVPGGSSVTIINRSKLIGRPLAMMLLNRDYTPTVCHSKTIDLQRIARSSGILVTGVGKAGFITSDYVTENTVLIDASINFRNGKITGDADYENLRDHIMAITPVPGGVGAITPVMIYTNLIASLMERSRISH